MWNDAQKTTTEYDSSPDFSHFPDAFRDVRPFLCESLLVLWKEKYGPVGVIAGASEGLGAAYAEALASRGLDLILIARRADVLEEVATRLRDTYSVQIECHPMDLAQPDLANRLAAITAVHRIGLGIYNAAYAPVRDFLDSDPADLERILNVNARGPLVFARIVGAKLAAYGHGGLVFMSSLAGFQGTPRLATYAGTKAFNTVLAEGLWHELSHQGVDVLVSCAGAIRTPRYAEIAGKEAPGTLDAKVVAEQTLDALGRGPRVVPGIFNQMVSVLMSRWLPRRTAIGIMAKSTQDLG